MHGSTTDTDLVLLMFAGSTAEFALNCAFDWLFFTWEIPQIRTCDPLMKSSNSTFKIKEYEVCLESRSIVRFGSLEEYASTMALRKL